MSDGGVVQPRGRDRLWSRRSRRGCARGSLRTRRAANRPVPKVARVQQPA